MERRWWRHLANATKAHSSCVMIGWQTL